MSGKEELYRQLEQARRLVTEAGDEVSKQRIKGLIADLETQLANIEARDADAPSGQNGQHSPGEEEFGGGDICSPQQEPSNDDDKPLD